MTSSPNLDQIPPDQLRAFAAQLLSQVDSLGLQVDRMGKKNDRDQTIIEQLTHEIAWFKRNKFAKRSEQLSPSQGSLLDDLLDTDIAAIEAELKALSPPAASAEPRKQPTRVPLHAQFPRAVIYHEPDNTQCPCGCQLQRIGEDVSEKLDYTPGVFAVEQHARGKWVCRECETLTQASVPAQVIDKGIPNAGLLAHVMVAKFADHLPLYRQEKIFGRGGLFITRSTLAQWVGQTGVQLQPLVDVLRETVLDQGVIHADETPVQMLAPGQKNPPCLRLGLLHYAVFGGQGSRLRLQPEPCGRACTQLPWPAEWQAGVRRFRRLQGKLPARHHRNRLHGPRPPQVLRSARDEQKPTGRTGIALDWRAVSSRTASAGDDGRRSLANTSGKSGAHRVQAA